MKTEFGASKMVQWVRTLATKPEFGPQNQFGGKKKVCRLTCACMSRQACNLLTNCIRVKKRLNWGW